MNREDLLKAEIDCIEKVILECYEYYAALDNVEEELRSRYIQTIEEIEKKAIYDMNELEKEKYKYANIILN